MYGLCIVSYEFVYIKFTKDMDTHLDIYMAQPIALIHIGQKCFEIRIVDFVQYLLSYGVARSRELLFYLN